MPGSTSKLPCLLRDPLKRITKQAHQQFTNLLTSVVACTPPFPTCLLKVPAFCVNDVRRQMAGIALLGRSQVKELRRLHLCEIPKLFQCPLADLAHPLFANAERLANLFKRALLAIHGQCEAAGDDHALAIV
jgi:hypothetical protein